MRILIAVHHFPPTFGGGAEWRAYRTARGLQRAGHAVQVVCVDSVTQGDGRGLEHTRMEYDGIAVHRLAFNLAAAADPFRWRYRNPWIGEYVRELSAAFRPDVLHLISGYLMSGSTIEAAQTAGLPVVVTLTDFWFLCPRITLLRSNGQLCFPAFVAVTCARCLGEEKRRYRIPGRIAPGMMKLFWRSRRERVAQVQARMDFLAQTLNRVDAILSPSQFLRELFIQAGLPAKRITFCRQGRDFPQLRPEVLEKTSADHLRVGYLGQIAPHKGVHVLFEAVQRLPGAALEVKAYGDATPFGDYTRRLQQMVTRDSRLSLSGVCERTGLSRVLQGLDVVVVPSLWYENSPNTILEAFAHITPVIASDLGGMAELVQDGQNGFLFARGDATDLARKLRRLLVEPNLLRALRAGIEPVKSVAEEVGELEEVYSRVTRDASATVDHGPKAGNKRCSSVAIIVLNWNGVEDTLECLESLSHLDYRNYGVVVVDNGSTDGSVSIIRDSFPEVTIRENDENLGYTGGNNVGLRYALAQGTDYALLLNNDTEVAPDFLRRLVDVAEANPAIGIVGPTIYYHDQQDVVWSAGGAIDWRRGSTRMVGLNEQDVGQFGVEPRVVDFVTGCCMLIRRAVLEQVGLLDERFFAYYEDVDWCVRAQRAGFKVMNVPLAKVWHRIPLDARDHSPLVHYYMTRNRLLFLRTTEAGAAVWGYVLVAMYLRTWLSWAFKRRWRHKRQHHRMMVLGILDAFRGRWGARSARAGTAG